MVQVEPALQSGVGFVETTAIDGSGESKVNPRRIEIIALMISFTVAV